MPLSQLRTLRTTTEAAERLCKTPRYIAQLVARAKLAPALKLPGKTGAYLFSEAELERYEREHGTSAAAAAEAAA